MTVRRLRPSTEELPVPRLPVSLRRCTALAALVPLAAGVAATEAGPVGAAPAPDARPPIQVQVLGLNDFHGNLEPPAGSSGRIEGIDAGGAAYLA